MNSCVLIVLKPGVLCSLDVIKCDADGHVVGDFVPIGRALPPASRSQEDERVDGTWTDLAAE